MKKIGIIAMLCIIILLVIHQSMAKEIRTEITINAPAEKVWQVLTDFGAYPTWNPYIVKFEGTLKEGERMQATLARPDGTTSTLNPKVRELKVGERIVMRKQVLGGIIVGANHIFEVKGNPDGSTTFVQAMTFNGFATYKIGTEMLKKQFEAMNKALKSRVEAL